MNEAFVIDRDAHVQFLVSEMHEYQVAGLDAMATDGHAGAQLFLSGSRQLNPRAARGIYDQAAAVETAGRRAAKSIGLAEHRDRAVDHQRLTVQGRRRLAGVDRSG